MPSFPSNCTRDRRAGLSSSATATSARPTRRLFWCPRLPRGYYIYICFFLEQRELRQLAAGVTPCAMPNPARWASQRADARGHVRRRTAAALSHWRPTFTQAAQGSLRWGSRRGAGSRAGNCASVEAALHWRVTVWCVTVSLSNSDPLTHHCHLTVWLASGFSLIFSLAPNYSFGIHSAWCAC